MKNFKIVKVEIKRVGKEKIISFYSTDNLKEIAEIFTDTKTFL